MMQAQNVHRAGAAGAPEPSMVQERGYSIDNCPPGRTGARNRSHRIGGAALPNPKRLTATSKRHAIISA